MAAASRLGKHVFDLRIALRGISPEIWRLLSISADATLNDLHQTIQGAFRWHDSHLHEFEIGGKRYEDGKGSRTALRKLLHVGDRALYRYDMGDDWEHDIDVVRMYEVATRRHHPKVLDGARNGPPEDVGGPHGYARYAREADPRALEAFDPQLATWRAQEFVQDAKPAPRAKPRARKPPAAQAQPSALDTLVELLQHFPAAIPPTRQALLGFFTGLFAGPPVMPSAWIPYLFGDPDTLAWGNAQTQLAFGVAMDAYNDVGRSVYDAAYDGMAFDRDWARGFMLAVAAGGEPWKRALRHDDFKLLAAPIVLAGRPHGAVAPVPAAIRQSIAPIISWWRAHPNERGGGTVFDANRDGVTKIQPNAPCPCGSGKKYKRCCGALANIESLPAWGKTEADRAIALLMAFLESPTFEGAYAAARAEWFGDGFDGADRHQIQAALEHDQTQIAFNTWLLFDAYITEDRHRLMEIVLEADGPFNKQFTAGQRRFLERMAASTLRPYEIRDVRHDEGFTLKDMWTGEEITVSERLATHSLRRGETMFVRLIEGPRGATEMHGAVIVLEPLAMQQVLDRLRASFDAKRQERKNLDDTTFFKEAGPIVGQAWLSRFTWKMPQLRTSSGDVLRSQDLVFDIVDRDGLERALAESPEFEWNEDGSQWVWLGKSVGTGGAANVILASLTPIGARMRAHVMSDERATRLREVLGRIAPGMLVYRVSEMHDLGHNAVRRRMEERPALPQREREISPELEAEVLEQFFTRQYTAWLDEPIPALGGRTPRHAATLKTQRASVAALVRQIEHRPVSPNVPNPDVSWLWRELGLEDLR